MRFTADGPSIPDELLLARDEGRVVFFCGAGVSRARANLPDFFGLARSVINNLKVPDDHVVRLILKEAEEIQDRIQVGGLISADRLFGWLERDFVRADIEAAVSQALSPATDVDLSAHKILLRLATTPQGHTQLVTTNFDRLFNDCDPGLRTLHPPNLPNFRLGSNLDGLVYLHGRAAPDYKSAEGGYVLSTSGFGRAYLSDAWATGFLKDIIDRYVVVFVGYTADDPPVQYLLEALSQVGGRLDGVYAFQSGDMSEASAKWQYKGVAAIPYNDADRHRALWTTLEAWAARAADVDGWYRQIVDLAKRGPYVLMPHERGQVAHLLMTVEGTKRLCGVSSGVPADWICVIDPAVRYSSVGRRHRYTDEEERVDPFEFLSLDGDEIPPREDPKEEYPQRKIPKGVWNGLHPTAEDRESAGSDGIASLVNYQASSPSRLPPRMNMIGEWLAENADKPATFWWIVRQNGIHPQLELRIRRGLESDATTATLKARQGWRDLFASWRSKKARDSADRFDLERQLDKDGWNATAAIELAELLRPFKKITVGYSGDPLPPSDPVLDPDDIVSIDVSYVDALPAIDIPNEFLRNVARELRHNLEIACDLERSLGGFGLEYLAPLVPQREDDGNRRHNELNGLFFQYLQVLERLSKIDVGSAKNEVACWPKEDTIFSRLRIWAIKHAGLLSTEEQGAYLVEMSDVAFWSSNHQRDLMLALSDRWHELSESAKFDIERRLLRGRPLDADDNETHLAFGRQIAPALERLVWMRDKGLALSPGTLSGIAVLQARLPGWKPEYARHALDSMEVQVYSVETDTEHAGLVDVPSKILLARASEDARQSEDRRKQYDPFQGLCASRPLKALSALTSAARDNEFPSWAWRSFLNAESRKDDDLSLREIIARRIVQYSDQLLPQNTKELAEWQLNAVKDLTIECGQLSDILFGRLVATIQDDPSGFGSSVSKSRGQRDWAMEALNAPVGKLAQSLFLDPRVAHVERGRGFDRRWLESVEAILAIPESHRRYALTIFSHHLGWFYYVDPAWTKQSLLSVLNCSDQDDRMAFWAGFLWGGRKPETALYRILQPHLLAIARDQAFEKRGYNQVMAGLILSGWGTPATPGETALVSDAELRDLVLEAGEDFRRTLLWQGEQFAKREEDPTGSDDGWWGRLLHLFQDVWPRQFSVRTPAVTSRLCNIAFASGPRFPKFVQAVLPIVSVIDGDQMFLPTLRQAPPTVVESFAGQTLELLYAVLPANANLWPYGIDDVLKSLASADGLAGNQRLLELRRRLDKR